MNLSRRKFLKANRAMLALPFLHSLMIDTILDKTAKEDFRLRSLIREVAINASAALKMD